MQVVSRFELGGFGAPVFLAQDEILLPPEITSQEWNERHLAGNDLFHTIVYPSGEKIVGQVCKIPGGSGIARSVSVDEYRKQGGWPTCEAIVDEANVRMAEWPELTVAEWDALIVELQAEWDASGKTILLGLEAIVGGEFRQWCWYPNGQRGQQTAGSPMNVAVQGNPTCEQIWDHICTIPEAEGGVAGHPECLKKPILLPLPENGERQPPEDELPPEDGEPPVPVEEVDLTEGLAAGGIFAAITGVVLLA